MAPKPPPKVTSPPAPTGAGSSSPPRPAGTSPPRPPVTSPPPPKPGTKPATQILTNKSGTWAGVSSPPSATPSKTKLATDASSSSPDADIPDVDKNGTTTSTPIRQPPRPSHTIQPLKWWQKISVNSILGAALTLLKRLTAFPMLSSAAIYFDEDDRFDPSGNRKTLPANDSDPDLNPSSERVEVAVNYERATQALFEAIIRYRKEAKSAKDNYHTMKVPLAQFPEWNDNLVDRLRSTFQVFDITGDGLLDFEEFCTTLDEFGDSTTVELRKKYFATIDDGSGSIDFMEFIRLVYKLTIKTPSDAQELSQTFQSIDRNMGRIRSLDVVQQLQAGLF